MTASRANQLSGAEWLKNSFSIWHVLNRRRSSDGKEAIAYSDSDSDIGNISSYEEFLRALGGACSRPSALKWRRKHILSE